MVMCSLFRKRKYTAKFDPQDNIILLECRFSHKGRDVYAEMVLDTGATFTIVSSQLVEQLGIDVSKYKRKLDMNTASGKIQVPIVNIENVSVKGASAEKLRVAVHDLPEEARVDGLLGLNFLRNFNVEVNFKKGEIKLQ